MNATHPAVKTGAVIVTHILDTGTAFAVRTDNAEQVFLPPSLSQAVGFQEGDYLAATMVPNKLHLTDPSKAPWMAIHVRLEVVEQPSPPEFAASAPPAPVPAKPEPKPESFADTVLAKLKALDGGEPGLWGIKAVVAAMYPNGDASAGARLQCRDTLSLLHKQGRLSKVMTYARPDQKKASAVYYCFDLDEAMAPAVVEIEAGGHAE